MTRKKKKTVRITLMFTLKSIAREHMPLPSANNYLKNKKKMYVPHVWRSMSPLRRYAFARGDTWANETNKHEYRKKYAHKIITRTAQQNIHFFAHGVLFAWKKAMRNAELENTRRFSPPPMSFNHLNVFDWIFFFCVVVVARKIWKNDKKKIRMQSMKGAQR